jgi:hypothetical protein
VLIELPKNAKSLESNLTDEARMTRIGKWRVLCKAGGLKRSSGAMGNFNALFRDIVQYEVSRRSGEGGKGIKAF